MPESRQAEALRQRDTLERARAKRRKMAKASEPARSAHQWWLDLVARRVDARR